jgi:hypothetical protein
VLPAGEIVALDDVVTVIPFAVAVGDAAVVQVPVCPANEGWPINSSDKTHMNASFKENPERAISPSLALFSSRDFALNLSKKLVETKKSTSCAIVCKATDRQVGTTFKMVDLERNTRFILEFSSPKFWHEWAKSVGNS